MDLGPVIQNWKRQQEDLRAQLVLCDTMPWQERRCLCNCPGTECELSGSHLRFCGGVDISFVKGDDVNACASLIVVDVKDHSVIYEDYQMVQLTAPYVAGYLAFREVEFYKALVEALRQKQPYLFPQVILVDGNGLLHPRMFGVACHLGVLTGVPTVGIAKTLHCLEGLTRKPMEFSLDAPAEADQNGAVALVNRSCTVVGAELRTTPKIKNPVYVSVGHGISLETSLWVVRSMSKYRLPEPVRQADIRSRQYLREKWSPPKATPCTQGSSAEAAATTAAATEQPVSRSASAHSIETSAGHTSTDSSRADVFGSPPTTATIGDSPPLSTLGRVEKSPEVASDGY